MSSEQSFKGLPKSAVTGRVSEYAFASECLRRGIVIAFPCLEALNYDYVVDSGKELYRVQVKATTTICKRTGRWQVSVSSYKGGYGIGAYDVLVVHVPLKQSFYLIPKRAATVQTIRLDPEDPDCTWAKYLENWAVFSKR